MDAQKVKIRDLRNRMERLEEDWLDACQAAEMTIEHRDDLADRLARVQRQLMEAERSIRQ